MTFTDADHAVLKKIEEQLQSEALEHGETITLGTGEAGGSAVMTAPMNDLDNMRVHVSGSGFIEFESEQQAATIWRDFDERIIDESYWARLRLRQDKNSIYLDLLFGKTGEEPHDHFGFSLPMNFHFYVNRTGANVRGAALYNRRQRMVIPHERTVTDRAGRSVLIRFNKNDQGEVGVDEFKFCQ